MDGNIIDMYYYEYISKLLLYFGSKFGEKFYINKLIRLIINLMKGRLSNT